MLNIGVIGYGYWGPNVVRNLNEAPGAKVVAICDLEEKALSRAAKKYPRMVTTQDYKTILADKDIDAVAVTTPVSTHFELSRMALNNGKHVFIEKPFTASVEQAEELLELAEKKNLKLMVDHTFIFTGAVKKIKELIDDNTLGELYYFDSTRINLGLFQRDVNVVWDLAIHDLAILDFLTGKSPSAVTATGISHFYDELENLAFITLYYPDNFLAHINVNWLSPVKIRTTLLGAQKKMLVWNDLVSDEKIRVYDKGIEGDLTKEMSYKTRINYRSGDMWAPKIDQIEALSHEAEYFIQCIENDLTPINDGAAGLRTVKILEAIIKSLKKGGELAYL
ncbi:Gfo/Idh/MocA family oxidoreductase [Geotalea sp. SG265]|uniref:Gfo/Idh/MocA family protein n=1 Tax=Geotalea sp. SG265 TaxID=2922867 RepID=UPI001FB047D4|nr:Gfo/Idh/MocA family oxidoreductase [Geotalea sp. SG265]